MTSTVTFLPQAPFLSFTYIRTNHTVPSENPWTRAARSDPVAAVLASSVLSAFISGVFNTKSCCKGQSTIDGLQQLQTAGQEKTV